MVRPAVDRQSAAAVRCESAEPVVQQVSKLRASAWAARTHHILWEQRVHEVFAACICSQMHDGVYALTHSAAVVSRLEVKLHEGLVR
jgi:hypothetical protein